MTSLAEKKVGLMGVVDSLGQAKFKVPEVSVASICARLESGDESLVLLDTRSDPERAIATIPGSISKIEFEANPAAYSDKEVVCYW